MRGIRRRALVAAALAVAALLGSTTSAFTASGGGAPAGEGAHAVSGYAVTDVRYALDERDPARLESVSFRLAPAGAAQVRVRFRVGGPWYPCATAGAEARCATTSPQATLAAAVRLEVVAA